MGLKHFQCIILERIFYTYQNFGKGVIYFALKQFFKCCLILESTCIDFSTSILNAMLVAYAITISHVMIIRIVALHFHKYCSSYWYSSIHFFFLHKIYYHVRFLNHTKYMAYMCFKGLMLLKSNVSYLFVDIGSICFQTFYFCNTLNIDEIHILDVVTLFQINLHCSVTKKNKGKYFHHCKNPNY